ncbi:FMN-dependent NADH-azoreductase [Roseobacter weihaiensis]|uniref:FMN-dependent NADH-azoreductase n=1 Tax=Roseobacter weihaiensis TaxID=2763262 RepID=UPI001D0BC28B|nr:NAD(P)H-dependent oxidoreductase [Roseobacter sp. H9]
MTDTVLLINSSARQTGSTSRDLTARIAKRLGGTILERDLAEPVPQIDENWVAASFTPADQRTAAQSAALDLSDALVAEVKAADTLVIGMPIYNFGVPAALKAWIDQVARAGVTFDYTDKGPVGLLEGKRAIIAASSGGTAVGSDIDFATGYLRHFLGFIGIHDVEIVAADQMMLDADTALGKATAQIDALAA